MAEKRVGELLQRRSNETQTGDRNISLREAAGCCVRQAARY